MTQDRGPILRKRGQAPAPSEPAAPSSDDAAAGATASPDARDARPLPSPSDRRRPPDARREARPTGGRRSYDPRLERGDAPPPQARPAQDARGKRDTGRAPTSRPPITDEKSAMKAQAQKLAKEKGIPLVHAYRVLKTQTSLNDVLKGMMRKERFEQLVTRDGLDRELAGQVASGHLPKQRAVLLTRMRALRKQKLHIDGIKAAEIDKQRVAIALFGRGWVVGRVRSARPYDFDFIAENSDKSEKLFKHEVKAVVSADALDATLRACTHDPAIAELSLAATEDRSERVRPTDDRMLEAIDQDQPVIIPLRDGETLTGKLRSFGRWDAEVLLPAGEIVTVFFHALHASAAALKPARR